MDSVCIKGVSKADWLYFKSEAAKENKTMGEFLKTLVALYKESPKDNWAEILHRKPAFTKAEVEDMRKKAGELRTEMRFR